MFQELRPTPIFQNNRDDGGGEIIKFEWKCCSRHGRRRSTDRLSNWREADWRGESGGGWREVERLPLLRQVHRLHLGPAHNRLLRSLSRYENAFEIIQYPCFGATFSRNWWLINTNFNVQQFTERKQYRAQYYCEYALFKEEAQALQCSKQFFSFSRILVLLRI